MSAATVKKLEAELRRRYGRSAVGLLLGLPLDTSSRLRALGRLLGDEAGDPAMRSQCVRRDIEVNPAKRQTENRKRSSGLSDA